MNFPSLILFFLIWSSLSSLSDQTFSSTKKGLLLVNLTSKSLHQEIHYQKQHKHHHHHHQINQNTPLDNRSNRITGPGSWKHKYIYHKHRTLRTVHGTVNIIGWGVLLPIGAIIARYFRKLLNDWYPLHILSQLSGFLLGTLGWGLGISIKNEAKEQSMSTHGILGTIIFAFAALQPDEEHRCRKCWVIYHQVIGYALIALIIANIFQGINNQNAAKRWEWFYGAILGVLGVSALSLEVLRWRYAI